MRSDCSCAAPEMQRAWSGVGQYLRRSCGDPLSDATTGQQNLVWLTPVAIDACRGTTVVPDEEKAKSVWFLQKTAMGGPPSPGGVGGRREMPPPSSRREPGLARPPEGDGERERPARDEPAAPGRAIPAGYETRVVSSPSLCASALFRSSALVATPSFSASSRVPQHDELRGTTTSGNACSGARPEMTGSHSSRTDDHSSLKKVWMVSMSSARVSSDVQWSWKNVFARSTADVSELVASESRDSADSMRCTSMPRLTK